MDHEDENGFAANADEQYSNSKTMKTDLFVMRINPSGCMCLYINGLFRNANLIIILYQFG